MDINSLLNVDACVAAPPPGSVNVRIGARVEGPGGSWIPCAMALASGQYAPSLFQVGPGQRQVCAADAAVACAEAALCRATELATLASA